MLISLWIPLTIIIGVSFQEILCIGTDELKNCLSNAKEIFRCEGQLHDELCIHALYTVQCI